MPAEAVGKVWEDMEDVKEEPAQLKVLLRAMLHQSLGLGDKASSVQKVNKDGNLSAG